MSYVFGGLFLTNAIPHVVSGLQGKSFQSPFATPPGEGHSTSTVNSLWGWLNLALAYGLLCRVGAFDLRDTAHVATAAVPSFFFAVLMAGRFGRFNGGNTPKAGR